MWRFVLALAALQMSLVSTTSAQDLATPDQTISELLPLFSKNHCSEVRDPADQIFCGDPELKDAAARLTSAIAQRMSRLADRRMATEENADWIRNRNSSCGIFGQQSVPAKNIQYVKSCLQQVTQERIEILEDPNFDCLANNTTAGMVICSDADLALAQAELRAQVVAMIGKLKNGDAQDAFVEYARWIRSRDRNCDLIGKDNVPIEELEWSEPCLAELIKQKTAEIVAAKGDIKRVFGRREVSPSPDADAVDLCVAQIHAAHTCNDFLRVSRVSQVGREVAERNASVVADVEMVVLSPFTVCSPIASNCTGMCWNLKPGQGNATPMSRDSIAVAHRLRIQKAFAFQKTDTGSWKCDTGALQPVTIGVATSGP